VSVLLIMYVPASGVPALVIWKVPLLMLTGSIAFEKTTLGVTLTPTLPAPLYGTALTIVGVVLSTGALV